MSLIKRYSVIVFHQAALKKRYPLNEITIFEPFSQPDPFSPKRYFRNVSWVGHSLLEILSESLVFSKSGAICSFLVQIALFRSSFKRSKSKSLYLALLQKAKERIAFALFVKERRANVAKSLFFTERKRANLQ